MNEIGLALVRDIKKLQDPLTKNQPLEILGNKEPILDDFGRPASIEATPTTLERCLLYVKKNKRKVKEHERSLLNKKNKTLPAKKTLLQKLIAKLEKPQIPSEKALFLSEKTKILKLLENPKLTLKLQEKPELTDDFGRPIPEKYIATKEESILLRIKRHENSLPAKKSPLLRVPAKLEKFVSTGKRIGVKVAKKLVR